MSPALIVIDVQNDFCSNGALAVPDADTIIPVLNHWIRHFSDRHLPIVLTQDFHPKDHCSFYAQGGPWPPHCVAATWGAAFHPDLEISPAAAIFRKGGDLTRDAYSGFEGVSDDGLTLASWLHRQGVDRLVVGGLATDYCVRATVLDGLGLGFAVQLIESAMRGVEVHPGDSARAVLEMTAKGANAVTEGPPY